MVDDFEVVVEVEGEGTFEYSGRQQLGMGAQLRGEGRGFPRKSLEDVLHFCHLVQNRQGQQAHLQSKQCIIHYISLVLVCHGQSNVLHTILIRNKEFFFH